MQREEQISNELQTESLIGILVVHSRILEIHEGITRNPVVPDPLSSLIREKLVSDPSFSISGLERRYLEQEIKEIKNVYGQTYSWDEFRRAVDSAYRIALKPKEQDSWVKLPDQDLNIDAIVEIKYSGYKKGTKYFFRLFRQEQQTNGESNPDPGYAEPQNNPAKRNDHPEDRLHIAAHVALMLNLNALAVSQGKSIGLRASENPDLVGMYYETFKISTLTKQAPLPGFLQQMHVNPRPIVIGCEVKVEQSEGGITDAIRQTRHNCRFFDEGWLIAPFKKSNLQFVRSLAREYGIGVIQVFDDSVESEILVSPVRNQTPPFNDFYHRLGDEQQKKFRDKFETVHRLLTDPTYLRTGHQDEWRCAGALHAQPTLYALEALLTSNQDMSVVGRLPDTLQQSLRESCNSPDSSPDSFSEADLMAFAETVIELMETVRVEQNFENISDILKTYSFLSGLDANQKTFPYSARRVLNKLIASLNEDAQAMAQRATNLVADHKYAAKAWTGVIVP